MRNLIVCSDGTWCTSDQKQNGVPNPTNVARIYNAVNEFDQDGVPQLKYYHPGVGAVKNICRRFSGGALGKGLNKNIKSAYQWLAINYRRGDRIFLFGFSRGAYTVRSLAGMIARCGLLNPAGLRVEEIWRRVDVIFQKGYREQRPSAEWAEKDWELDRETAIYFIGVWDTVGALGIPLPNLKKYKKYTFHDTVLSDRIEHGRHAVALDEMRANFSPTLWTEIPEGRDIKQIWFPGSHGDVGGGHLETGLADRALLWMIKEAELLNLNFYEDMVRQIKPDYQDVSHDSVTGFFEYLKTQPRNCPYLDPRLPAAAIDPSVADRQLKPPLVQSPYRHSILLKERESRQIPVFATEKWNETGLFLQTGVPYRFTATGQWMSGNFTSGPEGLSLLKLIAGTSTLIIINSWKITKNIFKLWNLYGLPELFFRKRAPKIHRMALVGVIANGGNPSPNGIPDSPEVFAIKESCRYTPKKSGYFYCFANENWHFYDNNRGGVSLTVTRE